MNIRRFRIAVASGVVLLLVGIGAFLAYDMNAPIQEVRVYKVPEPGPRVVLAEPVAREETVTTVSTQEPQRLDDNDVGCCPDGPSLISEMVTSEDYRGHDLNPVSPEVIEDGKRIGEWLKTSALHQEKTAVHYKEGDELAYGLISTMTELLATFTPEMRAEVYLKAESQVPNMDSQTRQMLFDMIYGKEQTSMTEEQTMYDIKAYAQRFEEWRKKDEALEQQRPVYPILTHKH